MHVTAALCPLAMQLHCHPRGPAPNTLAAVCCRFTDKEVQRDAKLVSYNIVDRQGKPYVQVDVNGESKVRNQQVIAQSALERTSMHIATAVQPGAARVQFTIHVSGSVHQITQIACTAVQLLDAHTLLRHAHNALAFSTPCS